MKRIYLLFSLISLLAIHTISAQDEEFDLGIVRFLNYNNELPEELLSSKTAVFVMPAPATESSPEPGEWRKLAKQVHSTFRSLGIDPVIYYNTKDVLAGDDTKTKIFQSLKKRQIKNAILVNELKVIIKGKESKQFVLIATAYNGSDSFVSNGQKAWEDHNKDLDKVLKNFSKAVSKSSLTKSNNLIIEVPELYTPKALISGKRYEQFLGDLKLEKLAVPKFEKTDIPQNRPGGNYNNAITKKVSESNQKVPQHNKRLEQIMNKYPFKYQLVDYSKGDEALKQAGFQYVLLEINTSGESVRHFLGYDVDEEEDEYTTMKKNGDRIVMRSIPANAPVYKYYIKHLITGDVYLGNKWDADETWHEALENHINNMRRALKVK